MCGRMYVRYAVLPTKAVTTGVFWVFEHPRNFREKLDTQKQITHLLLFMPSTRLEMHRNRFRPGLRPDPIGEAYSAPSDPSWWRGGSHMAAYVAGSFLINLININTDRHGTR